MDEALPQLGMLYRYGRGLTGDPMYADDLVQETMLKGYRSWRQFRKGSNARAWLLTILRNTLNSDYRKVRRNGVTIDFDDVEPYVTSDRLSEIDPEQFFANHMVGFEVEEAVARLPDFYREAFLLSVEGLDYHAIAGVLTVPLGTVKSRISRARALLRDELLAYAVREGFLTASPATNDDNVAIAQRDVLDTVHHLSVTIPTAV